MFQIGQLPKELAKIAEKNLVNSRKMLEIYAVLWYTIYNMVSVTF